MFGLIYNFFYPQEELKNFYYISLIKEQDGTFSIHGLWPQTTPEKYPTFCKKVRFDIDCLFPIMGQLKTYWYSTMEKNDAFWKHEWQKHGSCVWTEMNEFEYFSNALRLYHIAKEKGLPAKYYDPKTKKCLIPVNKDLEFINS